MNYKVNIITTSNELTEIPFKRFEYPNLMELIVNTYYEDIGECLGKGLCGTCHVKLQSESTDTSMDSVEKKTLNTIANTDSTSRLACQIILDEKINQSTFTIITEYNLNP